jgi:hypothetical protein
MEVRAVRGATDRIVGREEAPLESADIVSERLDAEERRGAPRKGVERRGRGEDAARTP